MVRSGTATKAAKVEEENEEGGNDPVVLGTKMDGILQVTFCVFVCRDGGGGGPSESNSVGWGRGRGHSVFDGHTHRPTPIHNLVQKERGGGKEQDKGEKEEGEG